MLHANPYAPPVARLERAGLLSAPPRSRPLLVWLLSLSFCLYALIVVPIWHFGWLYPDALRQIWWQSLGWLDHAKSLWLVLIDLSIAWTLFRLRSHAILLIALKFAVDLVLLAMAVTELWTATAGFSLIDDSRFLLVQLLENVLWKVALAGVLGYAIWLEQRGILR